VWVRVEPMRFTTVAWVNSGLPRQFLADEREETMFDFVPFAGARRQVMDRDAQAGLIGQGLEFPLPQAQAAAVGAARVGGDQETPGLG